MFQTPFSTGLETNAVLDFIAAEAPYIEAVPYGEVWFRTAEASWLVSLGTYLATRSGVSYCWTPEVIQIYALAHSLGMLEMLPSGSADFLKAVVAKLHS